MSRGSFRLYNGLKEVANGVIISEDRFVTLLAGNTSCLCTKTALLPDCAACAALRNQEVLCARSARRSRERGQPLDERRTGSKAAASDAVPQWSQGHVAKRVRRARRPAGRRASRNERNRVNALPARTSRRKTAFCARSASTSVRRLAARITADVKMLASVGSAVVALLSLVGRCAPTTRRSTRTIACR